MHATVSTAHWVIDTLIQALGIPDHEVWSNGHLPGIDSVGPYPAIDVRPPTRYTSGIEYDDSPYLATVSAVFTVFYALFVDCGFVEGPYRTTREPKSASTRLYSRTYPVFSNASGAWPTSA